MDDSTTDPDFVPPKVPLTELNLDESFDSSDSGRSDRSRSLTPFLRSSCHQHRGKRLILFIIKLKKLESKMIIILHYLEQ